jgi:hypothetical protein
MIGLVVSGDFVWVKMAGLALQAAALAVSVGMTAVQYRSLPESIPIHFDMRGRPDQNGGRWWFLVMTGILASALAIDWAAMLFPQPRHRNAASEAVAQLVVATAMGIVPVVQYFIVEIAHGRRSGLPSRLIWSWFGLVFVLSAAAVATGFLT